MGKRVSMMTEMLGVCILRTISAKPRVSVSVMRIHGTPRQISKLP